MKLPLLLAASLAAFAVAAPAAAQSNAPGGLYVGALAGYEGLDVDAQDGSATASADSAVYGITAGYDLSLGGGFVGVEGEVSTSDGSTDFPSNFNAARDGLEASFALTPGIAAYGKIGYTALDTKAFTSAGSLDELEENAGGIRFGGGVQVQLPGPLEARVEYRRSRYEDVVDSQFGDLTTDQVVAGIGLRF